MNLYRESERQKKDRKTSCSSHKPQLNLLATPIGKVCPTCGERETLLTDELSWPWSAPEGTSAPKVLRNRFRRAGVLALTLLFILILSHIYSVRRNIVGFLGNIKSKDLASRTELELARTLPQSPSAQNNRPKSALESEASDETRLPEASRPGGSVSLSIPDRETSLTAQDFQAQSRPARNVSKRGSPAPVLHTTPGPVETADGRFSEASEGNAPRQTAENEAPEQNRIETRILQAIHNRAIPGIRVAFDGKTAYLEGRVKTESQKFAAEQAARAVAGVRKVNSTIRVDWAER